MPKIDYSTTSPQAAIDYLESIQREAALLQATLKAMGTITPAMLSQLETSIDHIDRTLMAVKAGYLYQPNSTRKT